MLFLLPAKQCYQVVVVQITRMGTKKKAPHLKKAGLLISEKSVLDPTHEITWLGKRYSATTISNTLPLLTSAFTMLLATRSRSYSRTLLRFWAPFNGKHSRVHSYAPTLAQPINSSTPLALTHASRPKFLPFSALPSSSACCLLPFTFIPHLIP